MTILWPIIQVGFWCVLVWLIYRAYIERRDNGGAAWFIPPLGFVLIVYGPYKLFEMMTFGEHVGVLWAVWLVVVVGLIILRQLAIRRSQREYAERLREMEPPENASGPAQRSDFKDWV